MYRFKKLSDNPEIRQVQLEIQDNFINKDHNGNVDIDGDLSVKDLYTESNTVYIGGIKLPAPKIDEDSYYMRYNNKEQKIEYVNSATPSTHASQHENGGADEIDLGGLSGEPAALTTHKAATSTHGVNEIADNDTVKRYALLVG